MQGQVIDLRSARRTFQTQSNDEFQKNLGKVEVCPTQGDIILIEEWSLVKNRRYRK